MPNYLAYRDDLETPAPDEKEAFAKIVEVMTYGQNVTRQKSCASPTPRPMASSRAN